MKVKDLLGEYTYQIRNSDGTTTREVQAEVRIGFVAILSDEHEEAGSIHFLTAKFLFKRMQEQKWVKVDANGMPMRGDASDRDYAVSTPEVSSVPDISVLEDTSGTGEMQIPETIFFRTHRASMGWNKYHRLKEIMSLEDGLFRVYSRCTNIFVLPVTDVNKIQFRATIPPVDETCVICYKVYARTPIVPSTLVSLKLW